MRIIQVSSCLFVHATLSWGFVAVNQIFKNPCSKKLFQRETNNKNDNHLVCFKVFSTARAAKRNSVLIQSNSSFVDKLQHSAAQAGETQLDTSKAAADQTRINSKRRKPAFGVISSHARATKTATRQATARSSSRAASSSIGTTTQDQVTASISRPKLSENRMEPGLTNKRARKTKKENEGANLAWETQFEQLLQYKEQYGHCLVPCQYSENPELGRWVKLQRAAYRHETMSQDRIRGLEDIGFAWNAVQAQWDKMFNQLVQYKERFGDCLVPERFQENLQLASWVRTQRKLYKMQTRQKMPKDHIQRLDNIGFVWEPRQASWEFYFDQLVAYKQRKGNCNVPHPFQENPPLGKWVYLQRKTYQSKHKAMSADRIERLNDVGFGWDTFQVQWETRFTELQHYKEQHGDCLVPQDFEKNPQLGKWVNNQRTCYVGNSKKKISEERVQRLNELGFEWEPHRAQWESRFKELVEYKRFYGNCLVPSNFPENPPLGKWVQTQRAFYKKVPKLLSDECIRRLDDIGFVWNIKEVRELRLRSSSEW